MRKKKEQIKIFFFSWIYASETTLTQFKSGYDMKKIRINIETDQEDFISLA